MKRNLHRAKKVLISFLTALAVAATLLVSGGTPAMAGSNGQQVSVLDSGQFNNFNKIRIRGMNNYGNPNADTNILHVSTYWSPADWYYGYQLWGWFWKGWVLVEVDWNTSHYRAAWCYVPEKQEWWNGADWTNCWV